MNNPFHIRQRDNDELTSKNPTQIRFDKVSQKSFDFHGMKNISFGVFKIQNPKHKTFKKMPENMNPDSY